jgi:DNA-binding LacI/PurR family transcriptional regulator
MSNIKDVAKQAGLSIATVSRVINGSGRVSEKNEHAVRDAVEKLNYKPNLIARGLATKRSNIIGLVIPNILNPFFSELAQIIDELTSKHGYKILIFNSNNSKEKDVEHIETLISYNVSGIIVFSSNVNTISDFQGKLPIVCIDRYNEGLPFVTCDNYEGGKKAGEILLANNCKNIAYIKGSNTLNTTIDRENGFLSSLKGKDVKFHCYEGVYTYDSGIEVAKKIFESDEKIDGIFCFDDILGMSVLKIAEEYSVDIPNDVKLIGFDNIYINKYSVKKLTTIAQPKKEMCEKSVEILMKLINNKTIRKQKYVLPVTVIKGKTCDVQEG